MAKKYTKTLPLRLTVEDEKKLNEVMKLLGEKTATGAIVNALYQLPRYYKLQKETSQSLENVKSLNDSLNRRINVFSSSFHDLIREEKPSKKVLKNQIAIDD